jgi:saccharopine dehydrogenase-like NADP-dependent oxidoreductase
MKISVLGAGLVGSAIVRDLAREAEFAVTAIDMNPQALARLAAIAPVRTVQANLRQDPIAPLIADSDLVVCAVPGFMGFATLRQIIEAKKNVVDISFFPEDALQLDDLAKANHVTAVVDCGVAPGLCNMMAGYTNAQLDEMESYICYVGGLPKIRTWPYQYKAVFSPIDVLEEYTRPARYVEHGREVIKPALSDVELLDVPFVGTLEAFNTDGLRSLSQTIGAPFMKEKTMRYPGHAELMRVFKESGFFNTEAIAVGGQMVSPMAVTSQLLFEQWKLQPGEEDLTSMRVAVEGRKNGRGYRYTYDLYDEYDAATQTHSMARTTGYTCTIIARQVIKGLFSRKGICPPEYVGQTEGCFADLLTEYKQRNIQVIETITEL